MLPAGLSPQTGKGRRPDFHGHGITGPFGKPRHLREKDPAAPGVSALPKAHLRPLKRTPERRPELLAQKATIHEIQFSGVKTNKTRYGSAGGWPIFLRTETRASSHEAPGNRGDLGAEKIPTEYLLSA